MIWWQELHRGLSRGWATSWLPHAPRSHCRRPLISQVAATREFLSGAPPFSTRRPPPSLGLRSQTTTKRMSGLMSWQTKHSSPGERPPPILRALGSSLLESHRPLKKEPWLRRVLQALGPRQVGWQGRYEAKWNMLQQMTVTNQLKDFSQMSKRSQSAVAKMGERVTLMEAMLDCEVDAQVGLRDHIVIVCNSLAGQQCGIGDSSLVYAS